MSAPAANPAPPEIPKEIQPALDAWYTRRFEADFAAKMAALPAQQQRVTDARDLQLDAPKGREYEARLGLRIKAAFLAAAERHGLMHKPGMEQLKAYVHKTKSVGLFASIFEQGGMFGRVTQSTEVIEYLRPESVLMRAGVRTVSGYGSKFVVGKQNTGTQAFWVGEAQKPEKTSQEYGTVELGAHKLMALAPISNDQLRLGNSNSAADVGRDVAQACALEVDASGLYGKGAKRPTGVFELVPSANKSAISGSTSDKISSDLKLKLIKPVTDAKLKLAGNSPFYWMTFGTLLHLSDLRESGQLVFPGLQNLESPTLNGFPVLTSEAYQGKKHIGFGLAAQLYFGDAVSLETTVGEATGDFESDMMTVRSVLECDWALRHTEAFSFLTGVTYGT